MSGRRHHADKVQEEGYQDLSDGRRGSIEGSKYPLALPLDPPMTSIPSLQGGAFRAHCTGWLRTILTGNCFEWDIDETRVLLWERANTPHLYWNMYLCLVSVSISPQWWWWWWWGSTCVFHGKYAPAQRLKTLVKIYKSRYISELLLRRIACLRYRNSSCNKQRP